MQGKWTNLENFPSQERKQKQKSLLTSIIRKQKKRLKNKRPGEGSGWEASSDRLEKATSHLVLGTEQLTLMEINYLCVNLHHRSDTSKITMHACKKLIKKHLIFKLLIKLSKNLHKFDITLM